MRAGPLKALLIGADPIHRYPPLLVFERQPRLGLAIRKAVLRRRGPIDGAAVIKPGPALDDGTAADLIEPMAAMDLAGHDRAVINS